MSNDLSISQLIVRLLRRELTETEGVVLNAWAGTSGENQAFLEDISREEEIVAGLRALEEMDGDAIRRKIEYYRRLERKPARLPGVRRMVYAALAAGIIAASGWGVYLLMKGQHAQEVVNTVQYSEIAVPHGTRQKVQLPDGSNVILNTGSRLKYPKVFEGQRRIVELEGEGYFVVKNDEQHPFLVKSGRQEVLVMGTTFQVRDYPGEVLQRTILENGKIEVSTRKGTVVLKPKQEAQLDSTDEKVRVLADVNTADVFSWKDGYFNFDNIDIRAAVWQIAQWYHKKVSFSEDVKGGTLGTGKIQQDLPLEELLKDLELNDLHFTLMDDTIFVAK